MPAKRVDDGLVYIADDGLANRVLLETILDRAGIHRTRSFADGAQLMTAIESTAPDLVFLDLRMPVMDGHAVLQALRDAGVTVPVIVLTGEVGRDAVRTALSEGARDFVTKPYDAQEVVLRARNLLELGMLQRDLEARNEVLSGEVTEARQHLEDRQRAWARTGAALRELEAHDSAEATAESICRELGQIPGLGWVGIVAVDAAGDAVPLAQHGLSGGRLGVNRAIPRFEVEAWRHRIGDDIWIGPLAGSAPGSPSLAGPDGPALAVVPLKRRGRLIGAIAAVSASGGLQSLREQQSILESFAGVAAALLAPGIMERQRRHDLHATMLHILEDRAFSPVFQPIVDLATDAVVGYEALTRFVDGTRPDRRFADATAVGLGRDLELAAITAAIASADALPNGTWLSLNVSPDTVLGTDHLRRAISVTGRRLVLEVTEHAPIEDYAGFRSAVASVPGDVRLAVDDAGAGHSSFRHILELRPQFVKLDLALVRGVDQDDVRQSLVVGLVYFAERTGSQLIAEGIETLAERHTLSQLGVRLGQGYLLGRPEAALARRGPDRAPARHSRPQLRPRRIVTSALYAERAS